MPLTGKFEADFSSFAEEVNKSVVSLNGFEQTSEKVAKSLSQMADRFSGTKIVEQGLEINRLFKTTDDLALLTKTELAEVGRTAAEAADKMARLGLDVPANLQKIATTAQQASNQTQTLHGSFQQFDSVLSSVGINIGTDVKAISEMTSAAGQTTSQLGLLATAGLAVGTAFASYNLTRKALEFVGVAEAVDKAAASVWQFTLGLNSAQDAATQAKWDVLAKASATVGHAVTDLTEAMKINDDTERRRMLTIDTSAARTKAWHDEIAAVVARGEFKQFTVDLASNNFELAELAKRYTLSAGALDLYKREQELATEAAKNAAEAAKKLSDQQLKDAEAYAKATAETAKIVDDFEIKSHGLAMKNEKEIRDERQKTLDARNAQVLAGLNQIQRLEAENTDFIKKQTLSATEYQLAKIDDWERAQIAAFKGTEEELARFTEQVKIRTDQQRQAFQEVIPIVTLIGKSAAEAEAERARAAKQTGDGIVGEYQRQAGAFEEFKGVVVAGTGQIVTTSEALRVVMNQSMNDMSDYINRSQQVMQAQRDRGEFFVPGMSNTPQPGLTGFRATGGPVMAGGAYVVGERGPELFRPKVSGFIGPTAGGVAVYNSFQVVDTEANIVRRVSDQITRSIKTSTKWGAA